jgi:hypothetical protein
MGERTTLWRVCGIYRAHDVVEDVFEESNAPFKCLKDGLSCRSCWKHLKAGTTVTLVGVEVTAVLAISGSSGSDGNVNLLDGDLEDLTVLGDVLGGDDLALGAIDGVVKRRRGSDSSSGSDLLVAGRGGFGGLVGGGRGAANLLLAKVGAVGVLAVITEDGRGSLAEVSVGRLGSLGR